MPYRQRRAWAAPRLERSSYRLLRFWFLILWLQLYSC